MMNGVTLILFAAVCVGGWWTRRLWQPEQDVGRVVADTYQEPVDVFDGGLLTGRGVWLPPFPDSWTLPDVLGTIDDIDRLGRQAAAQEGDA